LLEGGSSDRKKKQRSEKLEPLDPKKIQKTMMIGQRELLNQVKEIHKKGKK
jgi:hypothetical protein